MQHYQATGGSMANKTKPDEDKATQYIAIRISPKQLEQLEILRTRLQEKMGDTVQVTQKMVFIEALKALSAKYDRLERDKGRDR